MLQQCVRNDLKDLAVRAADCYKADVALRANFGKAFDAILGGANALETFRTFLPNIDGEIRVKAGLDREVDFYNNRIDQRPSKGRFQLLR